MADEDGCVETSPILLAGKVTPPGCGCLLLMLILLSLVLPWVDVGFATRIGLARISGWFVLLFSFPTGLLAFWSIATNVGLYKMSKNELLINMEEKHKLYSGFACGGFFVLFAFIGFFATVAELISNNTEFFGSSVNFSGAGVYVCLSLSIAMGLMGLVQAGLSVFFWRKNSGA